MRIFVALFWLFIIAGLSFEMINRLPPKQKFWAALQPGEKIGAFTHMKIDRLEADVGVCHAYLVKSGIDIETLPDRTASGCELTQQVSLQQSLVPYSAPVRARCPLIAALTLWERDIVAPAAERYFGSALAQIDHVGIFACRNVRGSKRRSQHAAANAIDITGFRLQNGSSVSLLRNWNEAGDKGEFLRVVRDGACRIFGSVLGPDYNTLHRDHFHLDLGPYRICR
jgi:hypothetical protein